MEIEQKSHESRCNLNMFWYLNDVDGFGVLQRTVVYVKAQMRRTIELLFSFI